jgi:hypothetical protein
MLCLAQGMEMEMLKNKDDLEEAASRWEDVARDKGYRCERCGNIRRAKNLFLDEALQLVSESGPEGRLMPTGPKGEKRPADVIGNAVHVMKILTGEIEDTIPDDGKDPAAKALGKKGGAARAKAMTPERRAEIAKKAAAKRWKNK